MQFDIEYIENFLATMVLEKIKIKMTLSRDTNLEKTPFHLSLLGN
jgi:hypothetical protein